MPRVPLLNPQLRRNPAGLGGAADPQEARQWGQGFAQLGEAMFKAGSALHKLDSSNAKSRMFEAEAFIKKRTKQFYTNEIESSDINNRKDFSENIEKKFNKFQKEILKEAEQMFGRQSPENSDRIRAALIETSSSFIPQVNAKGVERESAFITMQADSAVRDVLESIYIDPLGLNEYMSEAVGLVGNLYESNGVSPDDPKAQDRIKSITKQGVLQAVEGLISQNMFEQANDLIVRQETAKFLTAEEQEKFSDKIIQRAIQAENLEYQRSERSRRQQERELQEMYNDNKALLLGELNQAVKDENFEAVAQIEKQMREMQDGGGLGSKEANEVKVRVGAELQKVSFDRSYSELAKDFYSLNTDADLLGLQSRVNQLHDTYQLTDQHSEKWLSLIQKKRDSLKSDPQRNRLINFYMKQLQEAVGLNNRDLQVQLTKFNDDPNSAEYQAFKNRAMLPVLQYGKEVYSDAGINPEDAFLKALDISIPGGTTLRPQLFIGRPVPESKQDLDEEKAHLKAKMLEDKLKGEYNIQKEIEALDHLERIQKSIEEKARFPKLRERVDAIEEQNRQTKILIQDDNILQELMDNLGTQDLEFIGPRYIPVPMRR